MTKRKMQEILQEEGEGEIALQEIKTYIKL